jgi:predicted dehydrogenase
MGTTSVVNDIVWYEYAPPPLSSYALEMEAFARFVVDGTGPTDGLSERRSLAIIEEGVESAATGRPVDLAERFGTL